MFVLSRFNKFYTCAQVVRVSSACMCLCMNFCSFTDATQLHAELKAIQGWQGQEAVTV